LSLNPAQVKHAARRARKTLETLQGMVELKAKLLKIGREAVDGLSNQDGRNGVLLHGLPGNGKTTIAEALAGSLKLPFMYITFGSVGSSWVNQTTEQMVEVFRDAEKQAPCVLFLDEIDSLLRDRSGPQGESESAKIVNVLLTEMVNIRGKGVLLMAATNHLDQLDTAGVREGRFDFKVEVPPPDQPARVAILEASISKMAAAQRKFMPAMKKPMLEAMCSRWEGFSAARIDAIGKAVVDRLDSKALTEIDAKHIKQALRVVQGIAVEPNPHAFDGLAFEPSTIESLTELAYRMAHVEDIEAMGGSVPRGVLFYGDPGTGKTKSAKALAEAASCSLISTSGITLMKDAEEIDKILAKAAMNRPCVVFIDEADDVFGERNGSAASNAVTNKMLAAMDGTGANVKDVMFIAATNHPDRFDSAALRGGRLTTKVRFELPSANTIGKLVDMWKRGLKMAVSESLSKDQMVAMLAGNSHADVSHALDGSVNAAISRHKHSKFTIEITEADLSKSMTELGLNVGDYKMLPDNSFISLPVNKSNAPHWF
jgi:transitional endoplasmic reticulum ATPase